MAADGKEKKKGGMMTFIVLALLLTMVGAGAGFTVGTIIQSPAPEETALAAEAKPAEHGAEAEPKAADPHAAPAHGKEEASAEPMPEEEEAPADLHLKVQPFPPVLTTLASPPGRWVRLEGSALLMQETEEAPEVLAEKAAEQVLTYLRTVRLEQVEGPSGVLGLREDLNEMVKVLSAGQVQGILVHGLVVE